MEQNRTVSHEVKLCGRNDLRINGVEDVLGFDENEIVTKTVMGILNIEGSNLHIVKLDVDVGELMVSGKVDSLYYTEPTLKKRGLFGRSAD